MHNFCGTAFVGYGSVLITMRRRGPFLRLAPRCAGPMTAPTPRVRVAYACVLRVAYAEMRASCVWYMRKCARVLRVVYGEMRTRPAYGIFFWVKP